MGTTANRSYPYPEGSDAVDVPGDVQALADAADGQVLIFNGSAWVNRDTTQILTYSDLAGGGRVIDNA